MLSSTEQLKVAAASMLRDSVEESAGAVGGVGRQGRVGECRKTKVKRRFVRVRHEQICLEHTCAQKSTDDSQRTDIQVARCPEERTRSEGRKGSNGDQAGTGEGAKIGNSSGSRKGNESGDRNGDRSGDGNGGGEQEQGVGESGVGCPRIRQNLVEARRKMGVIGLQEQNAPWKQNRYCR